MALDVTSTRARPRDVVKVVVRRKRALRREQIEAVLTRRARGLKAERIAHELRMDAARVEDVIADRRMSGDPRALTDKQAAAAAARAERRWHPKADPAMPPAPPPLPEAAPSSAIAPAPRRPVRVVRAATFAPGEEAARANYVAMLRDASTRKFLSHPHAASTFAHLADLFAHCPTAYPTFVMRDGGGLATLDSTDRLFPRHDVARSLTTSHADLCAAG